MTKKKSMKQKEVEISIWKKIDFRFSRFVFQKIQVFSDLITNFEIFQIFKISDFVSKCSIFSDLFKQN